MESLFQGQNMTYECRGCPYGVQLQNTLNQIGNKFKSKHLFKSISSNINNTKFVAITKDQEVITYGWDGDQFNKYKPFKIKQIDYHCFNAYYTLDNNVLIDCYHNNNLLLFYQLNDQLIRIYQHQSQLPKSTKILQLINQTSVYTLYGQYFLDYQILTLFQDRKISYLNISTWQQGFQDFITSQGFNRTNFIYISNNENLFQIIINENEQFQILTKFNQDAQIITFTVYQSLVKNSQCDQLIVLLESEIYKNLWYIYACYMNFIVDRHYYFNIKGINIQNAIIFANQQFLIFQQNYLVMIYQIDFPERVLKEAFLDNFEKLNLTKFLHFDQSKSILFEFGYHFTAYFVTIPNLNGYFPNNSSSNKFTIYRTILNVLDPRCKVKIFFTVLSENDTLIYNTSQSDTNKNYVVINKGYNQIIENYSGSLLQLSSIFTEMYVGDFELAILQSVNLTMNLNFQLASMMNLIQQYLQNIIFIAGIQNETLFFYQGLPNQLNLIYHQDLNQSDIQQIQLAQNLEGIVFVSISLSQNQILLFTYNSSISSIDYIYINVPQFQSILQSYNCIVVLTKRNQVLVIQLNGQVQFHLDEDNIKRFFPQVQKFRPTAIALNQFDLSSLLIIGNEQQILICSITNEAILTPLIIQNLEIMVFDIKVLKNKIIIIYRQNDLLSMCFQVWEIANMTSIIFEKNLRCTQFDEYQMSTSDNQFFFVKQKSNNMLVYNPNLPQHASLYYNFTYNQSYLACTYIEEFSQLLINGNLYNLYPIITMKFTPNLSLYYQNYEKVVNYFFNITSGINKYTYQITPTYTLRLINNFINISFNVIDKQVEKDEVVILHQENISNNSQIAFFSFLNGNYEHSECNLYNSLNQLQLFSYNSSYNILTAVDGLFVLQSQNYLFALDSQYYNYTSDSIESCYLSYSSYTTLYSICQNKNQQLIVISFNINAFNIQQLQTYILTDYIQPLQFVVLFEMYFVLENLDNQTNIFIYIPQKNYSLQLTDSLNCTYFSVTNFRNTTQASQQISLIAVFYICSYSLHYQILEYNLITQELFQISKEQKINIQTKTQIQQFKPYQFLVVKNYYSEIIVLLTTTNFCTLIISMAYDSQKLQYQIQQIIGTIPLYGNLTLKNSQLANGILINTYKSEQNLYYYTFYNLTKIKITDLGQPLLMIGGLVPQNSSQMIAAVYDIKNQNGQFFISNDTNGILYNITPMSIICRFNLSIFAKSEKFKYSLLAENAFGQNQTELTFIYERNQNNWVYGLISIVAFCLIIALYIYWKKLRTVKPIKNDYEEEFEL
ncbi:unnamed protein product [Paramecium pentaurelia]|uniref:Transmembrane protein n=1 Tax=Paramecium pentaurelia TaxID=43138 RepID=A0A8S1X4R2_9CILI|nr:unnamed protein product [Paramecium pentaurelia]